MDSGADKFLNTFFDLLEKRYMYMRDTHFETYFTTYTTDFIDEHTELKCGSKLQLLYPMRRSQVYNLQLKQLKATFMSNLTQNY